MTIKGGYIEMWEIVDTVRDERDRLMEALRDILDANDRRPPPYQTAVGNARTVLTEVEDAIKSRG